MRDQTKCNKCGAQRDYAIKSGKRAGKLHTYCRKCLYAQTVDWAKRNADRNLENQRRWLRENPDKKLRFGMRRYGTDEAWYNARLAEQNGVCAICHRDETQRKWRGRLSVDHCHETNQLRGLLCNTCNMRLAGLEAHDWLKSAMEYLQKYKC